MSDGTGSTKETGVVSVQKVKIDVQSKFDGKSRKGTRSKKKVELEYDDEVDFPPGSCWVDFCEETALVGFKYMLKKYGKAKRWMWMIVISTCMALMILQLYKQVLWFIKNPITVNFEKHYPKAMTFPTVIVCNNMQFRMSEINASFDFETKERLFDVLDDVFRTPLIDRPKSKEHPAQDLFAEFPDAFDFFHRASQKRKDFILKCTFGSNNDCETMLHETMTENGICFAFNPNGSSHINISQAGENSGLTLILNLQAFDGMSGPTKTIGASVGIFEPGSATLMGEKALSADKGDLTKFGITKTVMVFHDGRECALGTMNIFNTYSQAGCVMERRYLFVQDVCGCIPAFRPDITWQRNDVKFCSVDIHYLCVQETWAKSGEYVRWRTPTIECPMVCRESTYNSELSSAQIAWKRMKSRLMQNQTRDFQQETQEALKISRELAVRHILPHRNLTLEFLANLTRADIPVQELQDRLGIFGVHGSEKLNGTWEPGELPVMFTPVFRQKYTEMRAEFEYLVNYMVVQHAHMLGNITDLQYKVYKIAKCFHLDTGKCSKRWYIPNQIPGAPNFKRLAHSLINESLYEDVDCEELRQDPESKPRLISEALDFMQLVFINHTMEINRLTKNLYTTLGKGKSDVFAQYALSILFDYQQDNLTHFLEIAMPGADHCVHENSRYTGKRCRLGFHIYYDIDYILHENDENCDGEEYECYRDKNNRLWEKHYRWIEHGSCLHDEGLKAMDLYYCLMAGIENMCRIGRPMFYEKKYVDYLYRNVPELVPADTDEYYKGACKNTKRDPYVRIGWLNNLLEKYNVNPDAYRNPAASCASIMCRAFSPPAINDGNDCKFLGTLYVPDYRPEEDCYHQIFFPPIHDYVAMLLNDNCPVRVKEADEFFTDFLDDYENITLGLFERMIYTVNNFRNEYTFLLARINGTLWPRLPAHLRLFEILEQYKERYYTKEELAHHILSFYNSYANTFKQEVFTIRDEMKNIQNHIRYIVGNLTEIRTYYNDTLLRDLVHWLTNSTKIYEIGILQLVPEDLVKEDEVEVVNLVKIVFINTLWGSEDTDAELARVAEFYLAELEHLNRTAIDEEFNVLPASWVDALGNLLRHCEDYSVSLDITEDFFLDNVAVVDVHFQEISDVVTEERRAYNVWTLMGDIGGTIGLYMGVAVLTLVEIAEFLIYRCCLSKQRYRDEFLKERRLAEEAMQPILRPRKKTAKSTKSGENVRTRKAWAGSGKDKF